MANGGNEQYNANVDPSRSLAAASNRVGWLMQPNKNTAYKAATMAPATMTASTMQGVGPVQSGQLADTDLSPYMNPYTNQVVRRAQGDLRRSNRMAMNDVGAAASAAGAFGGSRHGLVEAETNRAYLDQSADMAAGLRQAGYQNAQQAALADIGNRMQADTTNARNTLATQAANQNAINAARQYNASARNNAGQFNAGAQNAASQFNRSFAQNERAADLAAAQTLAGMGQQGFNMGQTINSNLAANGATQQAMMQALIDAAKGQYAGFTSSPVTSMGLPLQALSSIPIPQTSTSSSNPGLLGTLAGVGTFLGAL